MSITLVVPSLGESVQQAQVGTWLKQEGEAVAADEPIVEVESEKATVALPAPAAGVLRRQLKRTGDTVTVGEVIGELEEGATATPTAPTPNPSSSPNPNPFSVSVAPSAGSAPSPRPSPPVGEREKNVAVRLTPSARRALAEHGAAQATALGKEEVLRALAPSPRPSPPAGETESRGPALARPAVAGDRERVVPMSPLRRTVARRLLEAQSTAAILTTFNEIDMSKVLALREKLGPAFLEKHGVKLGFMSLFVKGAVEGLRAFPAVNAEVRGDAIVYKDHYDVGVAVGGGKGLVVPVVRDADRLSFAEIEKTVGELARKARENRITMDDLAGGTFTISNGGIYGSLLSTPILNPPQSGILGLHKIQKRPVAIEGDAIAVRPMMYVALSYDHRLVDGREAVGFLVRVKECLEDPERLLLEV
ncbi:MAG TPA: 2-oxoglutarate dehydrogenase complex dihydrolipoyllysine-residue succinyltransferase [Anaeromyxobacteraceae bacterium]|nr:2-oxoglutarate dehydrogenase complex dihydrolipoyllysine-residue succinyltransferase [Anaeromyxobacteraceae bacterium]